MSELRKALIHPGCARELNQAKLIPDRSCGVGYRPSFVFVQTYLLPFK